MSEEPSDEFLSGRRGLPDKSSNAADPKPPSRVPEGSPRGGLGKQLPLARRDGEKLTQQQLNVENSHKKARSAHCTGGLFSSVTR